MESGTTRVYRQSAICQHWIGDLQTRFLCSWKIETIRLQKRRFIAVGAKEQRPQPLIPCTARSSRIRNLYQCLTFFYSLSRSRSIRYRECSECDQTRTPTELKVNKNNQSRWLCEQMRNGECETERVAHGRNAAGDKRQHDSRYTAFGRPLNKSSKHVAYDPNARMLSHPTRTCRVTANKHFCPSPSRSP